MSRGLTRCFPNREKLGTARRKCPNWDGWGKIFTTGGTEDHGVFCGGALPVSREGGEQPAIVPIAGTIVPKRSTSPQNA
jgi:hypothetical protein